MKNGFLKVAVTTPDLRVADCEYNKNQMVEKVKKMAGEKVSLVCFPEFSLTGYTCGDLFLHDTLVEGAKDALAAYCEETKSYEIVSVVGLPLDHNGKLYNVAAVIYGGKILGFVPKSYLPNYSEFYEARQFVEAPAENGEHLWKEGESVPFGANLIFTHKKYHRFSFGIELCEDLWTPIPPSGELAMAGAHIILNLSASDELTGKAGYRRELVKNQSARTLSAYLYADAGEGESTMDMVFAGHNLIVENGVVLKESKPFAGEKDLITEIDLGRLHNERRRMTTFTKGQKKDDFTTIWFDSNVPEETKLTRSFEKTPFVPSTRIHREERCEEILAIQSYGLAKRLRHTGCKHAVIGLSGGLDSTLALLVTVRAFDTLNLEREGIVCVTMPCFGTTNRTYDNAVQLAKQLGTSLREIRIQDAVMQHFKDISHDPAVQDVTYENGQARERTQILMDIANKEGGIVVGTGDMSELALGWCTYNGDHMSMYAVNVSVPKTLVKYLVRAYAELHPTVRETLESICDTIISPELLPPDAQGNIAQSTEATIGKYDLHDFFLYHFVRNGFTKEKIQKLAEIAFAQKNVTKEEITSTLDNFFRRFYAQQFKRSCLPDGPKVGTVSLSPRGDWRMPSDAKNPY